MWPRFVLQRMSARRNGVSIAKGVTKRFALDLQALPKAAIRRFVAVSQSLVLSSVDQASLEYYPLTSIQFEVI